MGFLVGLDVPGYVVVSIFLLLVTGIDGVDSWSNWFDCY